MTNLKGIFKNMQSKSIIINTYDNLANANNEKDFLERSGIECYLSNDNTVQLLAMHTEIDKGIKLHVNEKDAERAIALLARVNE